MQLSNAKIVFMGSPEFAIPTLEALAQNTTVVGVVTQPDKPAGRGRTLTPSAVKLRAQGLDLPVITPRRMKEPEAMQQLQDWAPDVIVVAAFGQILRKEVLELPPYGCVNVHASLLPRWRGAAPINAAILHGDPQTGVTIMMMDEGIDTGPVLARRVVPIDPDDTAGSLSDRLAEVGADLLSETLPAYLEGVLKPIPQETLGGEASYAPMLKKEEGQLDFSQPAIALALKVRAFNPWPGAFTYRQGQMLKIHKTHAVDTGRAEAPPGRELIFQGLPAYSTAQGLLVLDEVQPAGKKPMPGVAFLHGARDWGT